MFWCHNFFSFLRVAGGFVGSFAACYSQRFIYYLRGVYYHVFKGGFSDCGLIVLIGTARYCDSVRCTAHFDSEGVYRLERYEKLGERVVMRCQNCLQKHIRKRKNYTHGRKSKPLITIEKVGNCEFKNKGKKKQVKDEVSKMRELKR